MAEYALHGPSNITDKDEGIHWELASKDNPDQIDTWWSGNINMKDENGELVAMQVYVQNRTSFGCAWVSISVWRGIKKNQVECEYHLAQLWSPIEGDFNAPNGVTYRCGLNIKMIKGGDRPVFMLTYKDEARDCEFEMKWEAISGRLPWVTDNHFDQIGHVTGYCNCRGEHFEADTINLRDRGWAPRNVDQSVPKAPVFTYVCVTNSADDAFCAFDFDLNTVGIGGEGGATYAPGGGDYPYMPSSWRMKNGVPRRLKEAKYWCTRGEDGWVQDTIKGRIVDEDDDVIEIEGKNISTFPYQFPENCITTLALCEGTMNGKPIEVGRMRWDDNFDNDTMLWLQKNPVMYKG